MYLLDGIVRSRERSHGVTILSTIGGTEEYVQTFTGPVASSHVGPLVQSENNRYAHTLLLDREKLAFFGNSLPFPRYYTR
jgi:hypothetical protein